MHLAGSNGNAMALIIEGYQFPDISPLADKWDRNWLMVRMSFQTPEERWSVRGPCLTTDEALGFAGWLRRASIPGEPAGELDFLEPTLVVRLLDRDERRATVEVELDLNAVPPSKQTGLVADRHYSLVLPVDLNSLGHAADELDHQLKATPSR